MARLQRISKSRVATFRKRFYGASVALFFLVTTFVLLGALGQNQDTRQRAVHTAQQNLACNEFSRSWGEWCVYTFTDDRPESLIAINELTGLSAWFRNGSWNLVASGLMENSAQYGLYLFHTDNAYGVADWQMNAGKMADRALIDASFDAGESADAERGSVYLAKPEVVPIELLSSEEIKQDCCDTLLYVHDVVTGVGSRSAIHHASMLPWDPARIERAGQYGSRNPLMSSLASDAGIFSRIDSVRSLGNSTNGQYHLVVSQISADGRSQVGLAQASWVNTEYTLVKDDLLPGVAARDPQLVRDASGIYHLFYTRVDSPTEIWSARSARIEGPYTKERVVLTAPEESRLYGVRTPFVVCNPELDQWQLFFIGDTQENPGGQLFTAFLTRRCAHPPTL